MKINYEELHRHLEEAVRAVRHPLVYDESFALGVIEGAQVRVQVTTDEIEFFDEDLGILQDGSQWSPRGETVRAADGDLFWVVDQHDAVVLARWNVYPRWGTFQSVAGHNDEGMQGFAVKMYQPIQKPEAPTL